MKPEIELLVTDLDNTLWDWLAIWSQTMETLIASVSKVTGVEREEIITKIAQVNKLQGTLEYSALPIELFETFANRGVLGDEQRNEIVQIMRTARREAARPFDGVANTLRQIKNSGTRIVGLTESSSYWSAWRLKNTGLSDYFTRLYSAADQPSKQFVAKGAASLGIDIIEMGSQEIKPDANLLKSIISIEGATASQTLVVGDSLAKDIRMAQEVQAYDAWAGYALMRDQRALVLLDSVSHWSAEREKFERNLRSEPTPTPSLSLQKFSDLLDNFSFVPLRSE